MLYIYKCSLLQKKWARLPSMNHMLVPSPLDARYESFAPGANGKWDPMAEWGSGSGPKRPRGTPGKQNKEITINDQMRFVIITAGVGTIQKNIYRQ